MVVLVARDAIFGSHVGTDHFEQVELRGDLKERIRNKVKEVIIIPERISQTLNSLSCLFSLDLTAVSNDDLVLGGT